MGHTSTHTGPRKQGPTQTQLVWEHDWPSIFWGPHLEVNPTAPKGLWNERSASFVSPSCEFIGSLGSVFDYVFGAVEVRFKLFSYRIRRLGYEKNGKKKKRSISVLFSIKGSRIRIFGGTPISPFLLFESSFLSIFSICSLKSFDFDDLGLYFFLLLFWVSLMFAYLIVWYEVSIIWHLGGERV